MRTYRRKDLRKRKNEWNKISLDVITQELQVHDLTVKMSRYKHWHIIVEEKVYLYNRYFKAAEMQVTGVMPMPKQLIRLQMQHLSFVGRETHTHTCKRNCPFMSNDSFPTVSAMELVGPKYRVVAGFVIQGFYSLGFMSLAGIAYFIRNWRYLEVAITAPALVFVSYWWYVNSHQ